MEKFEYGAYQIGRLSTGLAFMKLLLQLATLLTVRHVVDWTDLHEMVTALCYTLDGKEFGIPAIKFCFVQFRWKICHKYKRRLSALYLKGRSQITVLAHENFHCKDVSVAILWNACTKIDPTDCITTIQKASFETLHRHWSTEHWLEGVTSEEDGVKLGRWNGAGASAGSKSGAVTVELEPVGVTGGTGGQGGGLGERLLA
ncbi:unnamed protein product [Fraxinus pennsylvanica]|uniref:Uncharacterized protein n=1 Tax=Fraxinus pennsylvanica TaxID=56036 RepID=A0AAD2A827_9LAMI|nr:unnamed protein product [Fraxinus pennsylvanica]